MINGEAGGAVAQHRRANEVFQHGLAAGDISAELLSRLGGGTRVVIAVTRHLMALLAHASDQLRVPLGDPGQRKESDVDIGRCE